MWEKACTVWDRKGTFAPRKNMDNIQFTQHTHNANTMMKKVLAPVVAIALLGFWSCYPGSVTTTELDSVLTKYDPEFDFGRFQTFHLPDTIIVIGDPDREVNNKFDDEILEEVRLNLLALGWSEEEDVDQADVVVTVEKTRDDLLVGWNPCCWCGYWCWYPGWPWPGGGYYPGYGWGGTIVYSYPVGTVFITMFDGEDTEDMEVDAPWGASFTGLVVGTDSQIAARIERAIDQAFEQSSYLGQ